MAKVSTGSTGDVKKIDSSIRYYLESIRKATDSNEPKIENVRKEICFEIGEIGVKLVEPENGKVQY